MGICFRFGIKYFSDMDPYVFGRIAYLHSQNDILSSGSKGRVSDTVGNTNHSLFALAFLNVLKFADANSVPLNMRNVGGNVRSAFAGNFNQKPLYYNPDTWQDGGGDFIFIPKKNLK